MNWGNVWETPLFLWRHFVSEQDDHIERERQREANRRGQ